MTHRLACFRQDQGTETPCSCSRFGNGQSKTRDVAHSTMTKERIRRRIADGPPQSRGHVPSPLPAWAPLVWWTATAIVLAVVVVVIVGDGGPLDDPKQGRQRPALLAPRNQAPVVDNVALPRTGIGRNAVLVAFNRDLPEPDELSAFRHHVPDDISILVVVGNANARAMQDEVNVEVIADPEGDVARELRMPRPKDGGPPVGYALVDRDARVRYATLDPSYTKHAAEIETIAGALQ